MAIPTVVGSQEWLNAWLLSYDDLAFVAECKKNSSLDYAVNIGFYRLNGRFPKQTDDIASRAIDYIADQALSTDTKWILPPSRTETRRQEEILKYFEVSEFGPDEVKRLLLRSKSSIAYAAMSYEEYGADVLHWCFNENMRAPQRTFIRRTHKALRESYAKSEYIRITQKIGKDGQRELLASVRGDSLAPSIIDLRDDVPIFRNILAFTMRIKTDQNTLSTR